MRISQLTVYSRCDISLFRGLVFLRGLVFFLVLAVLFLGGLGLLLGGFLLRLVLLVGHGRFLFGCRARCARRLIDRDIGRSRPHVNVAGVLKFIDTLILRG